MIDLPKCPCGSDKFYEDCCYKKFGSDGKRLFFYGQMSGNANGNWHPIPNSRLKVIIGTITVDPAREFASKIANESRLNVKNRKKLINVLSLFSDSYKKFIDESKKSGGEGVSFQIDSLAVRSYWRAFLINGRILLHFLGEHSRETLGLKQEVGSLNKKTLENFLRLLKETEAINHNLQEVREFVEKVQKEIVDFVALRDEEKRPGNSTIDVFPTINPEGGLERDGKVGYSGNKFNMIAFVKKSYDDIIQLTKLLM
jgi:hypothetical protein